MQPIFPRGFSGSAEREAAAAGGKLMTPPELKIKRGRAAVSLGADVIHQQRAPHAPSQAYLKLGLTGGISPHGVLTYTLRLVEVS